MEWDIRRKFGKLYQKFSDKTVSKALIRGEKNKIIWKCIDENMIQCHQIPVCHFGKSLMHRPLRFTHTIILTAKWGTSVRLLLSDKFV